MSPNEPRPTRSPDRPPAWPYLLAFSTLVILGLAFGEMARLARLETPGAFDLRAVTWVGRHRADWPIVTGLARAVTRFGNAEVAVPMNIFIGGLLLLLGERGVAGLRRREAPFWLGVALAGWCLNALLKLWFRRDRPAVDLHAIAVDAGSFSFPSGHAAFAGVFFANLAFLLARTIPARYRAARISAFSACAILGAAVAGSRVWLSVHYPSDVAGGLLIGVGWVLAAYLVRGGWARWRGPRPAGPGRPELRPDAAP